MGVKVDIEGGMWRVEVDIEGGMRTVQVDIEGGMWRVQVDIEGGMWRVDVVSPWRLLLVGKCRAFFWRCSDIVCVVGGD